MVLASFSQVLSGMIISLLIITYLVGIFLLALKGRWTWFLFSVIPFPPLALLGYLLSKDPDRPGLRELFYDRERYWHQTKQNRIADLRALFIPQKKS